MDYPYDGQRIVGCAAESLDLVRCRNVLHHVPDFAVVAQEFHRVLRTGGKVVIVECNEGAYVANYALDVLWYRYVLPRHDIQVFQEYRDHRPAFGRYFTPLSSTIAREKEVTLWKKL